MILVIAGAADAAASELASTWRAEVRCIRPGDLSAPGWRHYVGVPDRHGVIPGSAEPFPDADITGVLTRTPWISPYELPQIREVDREYAATEMAAFLLSWLFSLECPVVNRPMPGCLGGPPWQAPQWVAASAAAGLKISRTGRSRAATPSGATLTVVGTQCFGDAAPELQAASLRLAALAQVELLGIQYDDSDGDAGFVSATAFPSLEDTEVKEALLALLQRPARKQAAFPDLRPWRRRHRHV